MHRHGGRSVVTSVGEGRSQRKAPVMADVAKLAGVSHQTVSRVVNGSEHVTEDTLRRVLDAMRMLDYRPNPVARALATGKSQTLGVVSFNTTLYGPASTLFGIERAAHQAGYFVSIVSLVSLKRSSVLEAVDRLRAQGVGGILVIAPQAVAAHTVSQLPNDIPVVAVEAGPEEGVPVVTVDQFSGAALATQHLLDLGHSTVWHIAGPADWLEAQQRIAGWRTTLEAAGAMVPPLLVGDWGSRSGYEHGLRLAADREVTAIFAANDSMALGVLRALHEEGRPLPSAVSVVGFDDCPEAAYFMPPLTTIRQDFMEVGRRALNLMLEEIDTGSRTAARASVPPEIVVRQSTAPPQG
jgi:DNA-binding LacI/PurR family transcriptional regulator